MKNRTSLASFTMLSFVLMCAALVTLTVSCAAKPKIKPEAGVSTASLTAAEARELAREAWLFGLPLVMFEKLSWPSGSCWGPNCAVLDCYVDSLKSSVKPFVITYQPLSRSCEPRCRSCC